MSTKKFQGKPGTVTDWIRQNANKFQDREEVIEAASKQFPGATRGTFLRRINELSDSGQIKSKPKPGIPSGSRNREPFVTPKKVPKKFRMAVDVADVKEEYDDESKIEEGLANLESSIIKDNDFRMELGIAIDRWKLVSNLEKYSKSKIELRGKQFRGIYWGHADVLVGLRRKIEMT